LKAKSIAPIHWFAGAPHRFSRIALLIIIRVSGAEQAINTVYAIAENPDKLMGDIIKSLARPILSPNAAQVEKEDKENEGATQATQSKKETTTAALTKLLFIVRSVICKFFFPSIHCVWIGGPNRTEAACLRGGHSQGAQAPPSHVEQGQKQERVRLSSLAGFCLAPDSRCLQR